MPSNPNTRHLDTAISILGGGKSPKRLRRAAQVELELWVTGDAYTISSNGRVVESGNGDLAHAEARVTARCAAVRKLGKTVAIRIHRGS
jgi:hypothetical protein